VWLARFNSAGVPCAPVNTVPEALEDAQVQALKMQSRVPGEDFVLTALPISFDGERPVHRSVAPRLGQHNQDFAVPIKK
jgi:formyl-CoA transferase